MFADATVTPVPMLQSLAGWIGVDVVDDSLPEESAAAHRPVVRPARWPTAAPSRGLREFVEMLSGGPAEVIDGGGIWREGDAPEDVCLGAG